MQQNYNSTVEEFLMLVIYYFYHKQSSTRPKRAEASKKDRHTRKKACQRNREISKTNIDGPDTRTPQVESVRYMQIACDDIWRWILKRATVTDVREKQLDLTSIFSSIRLV